MSSKENAHIAGLDGLRGIAATVVVLSHCLLRNGSPIFRLGSLAVYVFFVLSGYLIAGILLRSRLDIENGLTTFGREFHRFWVNRVFRIFPVYYLVVFAVAGASYLHLIHDEESSRSLVWYLVFLENFKLSISGLSGRLAHTWSIDVEQQFYLLFPFVVLLVQARYVRRCVTFLYVALVLVSLLVFWKASALGLGSYALFALPQENFTFIFIGALLAVVHKLSATDAIFIWRNERFGLGAFCLSAGVLLVLGFLPIGSNASEWAALLPVPRTFVRLALGIFCGALVNAALCFPQSAYVRFLDKSAFRFLGKISYALYLIHLPLLELVFRHPHGFLNGMMTFLVIYPASVLLATISWYVLEAPMMRLKRRFLPPSVKKISSQSALVEV